MSNLKVKTITITIECPRCRHWKDQKLTCLVDDTMVLTLIDYYVECNNCHILSKPINKEDVLKLLEDEM